MSTRLAAASAILIGLFDVLLVIYVVAVPQGQRYEMGQIFVNYAENPLTMNVAWIVLTLTSLLALPVVFAMSRWLRSAYGELVQSVSLLALLGYGVSAASFLTMLGQMPDLAAAYVAGDRATQGTIAAFGPPQLDPYNVLVLGAVGVWLFVVNWLALREQKLSPWHAGIGLLLAISMWMAVLAAVLRLELLDTVAAGAGALLAPIWFVVMGRRLWRQRVA
ncbi:MAG: hypothetical protein KC519_08555 [Anaerolineae bacterium]|nr:hypothetical protein [Anaerolineae bacterium]